MRQRATTHIANDAACGPESAILPRAAVPPSDLAFAVHDAKNLLGLICMNVEHVRDVLGGRPDAAHVGEAMDDLAWATERLRALLEQALSRAESGPPERAFRRVRVGTLISAAAAGLAHAPRGVRVAVHVADATVEVDAELVVRAIANLVDNAVRHSPDGGEVSLAACVEGGWLMIEVADEGDGVPKELVEAIFEPGVSTRAGSGAKGFGLTFCRRVALLHGGTIEVGRSAKGGARFVMVLPVE